MHDTLQKKVLVLAGEPQDEIEHQGDQWLWVKKVPGRYRMSLTSIYAWEQDCPALGRAVEILPVQFDVGKRRHYVRIKSLEKIQEYRSRDTPAPAADDDWLTYELAQSLFDRGFLIKFSDSGDPRRKHRGKPHPLLKRPIKTKLVYVVADGRVRPEVRFSRSDLVKLGAEVKREKWVTRREAVDDYEIPNGTLDYYSAGPGNGHAFPLLGGKPLKKKLFPVLTERGRPTQLFHFWRPHIERMSAGLPRPGEDGRVYVDSRGRRWLPQWETIERIDPDGAKDVTGFDLFRWREECPHLPGNRGLRSDLVRMNLFRSKHKKVRVYSAADADEIKAALNGWHERPIQPRPVYVVGGKVAIEQHDGGPVPVEVTNPPAPEPAPAAEGRIADDTDAAPRFMTEEDIVSFGLVPQGKAKALRGRLYRIRTSHDGDSSVCRDSDGVKRGEHRHVFNVHHPAVRGAIRELAAE